MNILKMDIRRSIFSKGMALAILLGLFCILLGMFFEPIRSAINLYSSDLSYEAKKELIGNSFNKVTLWHFGNWFYTVFMSLIVCIPYTITYLQDKKSGFSKYIIIRGSYKKYIFSKVISVFMSGFIAILVINTIYFIIITLLDSGNAYRSLFYAKTLLSGLSTNHFNLFFILHSLICSIMGGVYAVIGLAVSSLIDRTLIAFAAPFIIYYLGTYTLTNPYTMALCPSIVNAFYMYEGVKLHYILFQLTVLIIISILTFLSKTYWSDNFA